jgi:hypothetical protein
VGDKATDEKMFENKRAECFWRLRERIKRGWQLIWTLEERKDLLMIKYKRWLNGKIRIMPKDEMRKLYWKSPDVADALSLTFRDLDNKNLKEKRKRVIERYDPSTGERIVIDFNNLKPRYGR